MTWTCGCGRRATKARWRSRWRRFRRYHAHDAWTWERMALTRARVIAGPAALRDRVRAGDRDRDRRRCEHGAAGRRRDASRGCCGTCRRTDRGTSSPGPAGRSRSSSLLRCCSCCMRGAMPEVLSPTTREALRRLQMPACCRRRDAALLIRADHTWRTVQGMLRITVGRDAGETLPEASARPLLRAMGAADLVALRAELDALAGEVRAAFVRYVGRWNMGYDV